MTQNYKMNNQSINNVVENEIIDAGKNIKAKSVYDLCFKITLGISQEARLQISNKLSKDDFEFLLTWIKRLENDITNEDALKDKTSRSKDKEEKITSEKPVSLSPLGFEEALEGLLKVKPKNEEERKKVKDKDNK